MIKLTRINGQEIYLNIDLIKFVEKAGDTRVTFENGTMLIVREDPEEISKIVLNYRRELLQKGVEVSC